VAHAYKDVPYYRRLFDSSGLHPAEFGGLRDLSRIPFTQKSDIQQLPESEILARGTDPKRLRIHHTSGSTGIPLVIRFSGFEDRLLAARRALSAVQWGWRPWRSLTRIKLINPDNRVSALGQLLLQAGLLRLSAEDDLLPTAELLRRLEAAPPEFLLSYPETLHTLALRAQDQGGTSVRPRAILFGGSAMHTLARNRIEAVFNCPTREAYACHEFNLLASQCPHSRRLHVAEDFVILEVLKDGRPAKPGETGEVVVTSLHSFAQPFIRYRISDFALQGPSPCPCGSPFSTLERVEGRLQDWILFPDSSLRTADSIFIRLLGKEKWIRQFQLIQRDPSSIELLIVPAGVPPPDELREVETVVQDFAGGQLAARIQLVSEIPLEPNGKFRLSKSCVEIEKPVTV